MNDPEVAIARLHELKTVGVRLAIDDFGTGYSSLGSLQRLPVDTLKIDKSFVDRVARGTEAAGVVHALIRLASTLQLDIVAEGVEHDDQVRRLEELGCDQIQGFCFSQPVAPGGIEDLLQQGDWPALVRPARRPHGRRRHSQHQRPLPQLSHRSRNYVAVTARVEESGMTVEWWAWAAVIGFILAMLAVDLLFFHRDAHEVSIREAATWSAIWIAISLAFGGIVWAWLGGPAAGEYISGYLIEKSLSVDNLFVFALLLGYFAVPLAYQHRLLYWGVLGALVARAVFIFAGVALLEAFHWTIYVFGALLVFTGHPDGDALRHRGAPRAQPDAQPVAPGRADHRRVRRSATSSPAATAAGGRRRCSRCSW